MIYLFKKFKPRISSVPLILCVYLVCLKISLLPLTSFPYDFATYVYQIRQYFDFGIHPLFFWNKGVFLHAIFFGNYIVYELVINLLNQQENILLLHIFYKTPLLIFDLLIGFVIWKSSLFFTQDKYIRYGLLLLWLSNPMVFWATEIEGKYAIIASFFSVLSYYLFCINRRYLAVISLAISASIYYYAIVLFPIYLLFHISENRSRLISLTSIKYTSAFFVTLFVLFMPFFIWLNYLPPLISSLVYHAKPDAPIEITEINIPDYSFLNIPFYGANGYLPTNISSPLYFEVASKITFLGLILIVLFQVYLLFKIRSKKISYSSQIFLKYNIITLLIFAIFIGKFQAHYLIWLLPFIVLILHKHHINLLYSYVAISVLPIVHAVGGQDLGTYFLDSVPWGVVNFWLNLSDVIRAFLGALIFLALFYIIILTLKKKMPEVASSNYYLRYIIVIFSSILICSLFIFPAILSYKYLVTNWNTERRLASESRVLRFGFDKTDLNYDDFSLIKNVMLSAQFKNQDDSLDSNLASDFYNQWSLYKSKDGSAVITTESDDTSKLVLKLSAKGINAFSELNMGSNNSEKLLPLDYNKEYIVTIYAKVLGASPKDTSIKVRFADQYKKIIPGSDITLITEEIWLNEWHSYSLTFRPNDPDYKYLEIVASVSNSDFRNNELLIQSINVVEQDVPKKLKYTLQGKSNVEIVQSEILDNTNIRSRFNILVEFASFNFYDVSTIKLNQCEPESSRFKIINSIRRSTFVFNSSCANYDAVSYLQIHYNQVPLQADIQISLSKKDNQ